MRRQVFNSIIGSIFLSGLIFVQPVAIGPRPGGTTTLASFMGLASDPIYAVSDITIFPYPTWAGEPAEIGIELRNPTSSEQIMSVQFSYAVFGIGLPFFPINGAVVVAIPPNGTAHPTVFWIPPFAGQWCVLVELEMRGYPNISAQRNFDVNEPLLPGETHQMPFPVGNPLDRTVDISLGIIPHLGEWGIELNPDVLQGMAPGEVRPVVLSVTPPGGIPLPTDGTVIVDVEAYAEGNLIGGFRKLYSAPGLVSYLPLIFRASP